MLHMHIYKENDLGQLPGYPTAKSNCEKCVLMHNALQCTMQCNMLGWALLDTNVLNVKLNDTRENVQKVFSHSLMSSGQILHSIFNSIINGPICMYIPLNESSIYSC